MNKLTDFKNTYFCYLVYFVATFYAIYTFADEATYDLSDAYFTPLLSLFYFPLVLFVSSKKNVRLVIFSVGALISTISLLLIFYEMFIDNMNFGIYFSLELFLPILFYVPISVIIIIQQVKLAMMVKELVIPATIDFFSISDYISFSKAILIANSVLPLIITIAMVMESYLFGVDLLFLWSGLGLAGIIGIEKRKKWGYVLAYIAFGFNIIFLLNVTSFNSYYFYLYILFAISVALAALWVAISILHLFHESAVARRKQCD